MNAFWYFYDALYKSESSFIKYLASTDADFPEQLIPAVDEDLSFGLMRLNSISKSLLYKVQHIYTKHHLMGKFAHPIIHIYEKGNELFAFIFLRLLNDGRYDRWAEPDVFLNGGDDTTTSADSTFG